jgi:AraC-like DNA-binding protein
MSTHFRVSGLLRSKLIELSVSPEAVLRYADLPSNLFDRDKIYIATDDFFAMWRAIEAVSGDPLIGLSLGSEARVERYDPIAIAVLHTRSFRDALERTSRYKKITCPEEIRIVTQGDECAVQFGWTLARETEPTVLTDLCFAWIVTIGRRGSGGTVGPIRVELARPSAHRERYAAWFGCPIRFDAPENALVFRAADVERPFLTANAELLAMIAPQLESELAYQRAQDSARDQVKTTLKRLLAGQKPDIRDVARALGQSPRTLQRRLREEGVTYQRVLEEARRELARHYLLQSSRELNETAYLLGYMDANSFFRAFQQWEGAPPGRWREQQRSAAPQASRLASAR